MIKSGFILVYPVKNNCSCEIKERINIVNLVVKKELDYIEPIIQQLVKAYLDDEHLFPWFIANSNGKDSSTLSYCVWKAIERISVDKRSRKIYFATTDTLLEHPEMKRLMESSCTNMNEVAKEKNLPIESILVKPKMTAVMKMLAHGNPLPTPKSKLNRWCTDLLKIQPMESIQSKLIDEHGAIILMLGVRSGESQKRANSIKKYAVHGELIFPKQDAKKTVDGFYEKYVSHPIVDLTDEEVWRTITHARILPWGTRATTIRKMYEGAGECPIQVDKQSSKPCGGSSRNGCMICMMTTAKDDKMLQTFIDKGEDWAVHINRLRRLIRESLFDARFRKPINTWRKKKMDWVNPFNQDYDQKNVEWKKAKGKKETRIAFQDQLIKEQQEFDENSEGLCKGSKPVYPNLSLAGYTLQARIFLLKAFLYIQEVSGVQLVSAEELTYIKKIWSKECDWIENEEDIKPELPDYPGSLVLNADYTVNVEDTTIPNLTLYQSIVDEQLGWGMIIPPIKNKKLTPPSRKRSKMTKVEELAMLTMPTPKTINLNCAIQERYEAFYVMTDWGYDEKTIVSQLSQAAFNTGVHIPYYWLPSWSTEKRIDWKQFDARDHLVYWNTVVFIVCDPKIKSQKEASAYVNWYMGQAGEPDNSIENQWDDYYKNQYGKLSPFVAKQEMLKNGEDPEIIPAELKRYAQVTDEELTISRVMRYYGTNESLVERYLNGERYENVSKMLIEGMSFYEAKLFLIDTAYMPHVLPSSLKIYAEVTDSTLNKAHSLRYKDGLTGKDFWTKFNLSYLIKGMNLKEIVLFLVQNHYKLSDIPTEDSRYMNICRLVLSLTQRLESMGVPLEQIEVAINPFLKTATEQISIEDRTSYIQLEFQFGA